MRYLTILILAGLLASCGDKVILQPPRPYPPPPSVPELPKALEEECPALKPISEGSVKALVEAAATDAIIYADCKKKFNEMVDRYNRVKQEQDSHKKQLELFEQK